jgi:glutamate racemase
VEVYEHATPQLVPMVEAGLLTGPAVEEAVRDALAPLLGERDRTGDFVFPLPASARIDTLLLGCTHYPYLARVIGDVMGPEVVLVSSADETAFVLHDELDRLGLMRTVDPDRAPVHRFLSSGDISWFADLGRRLLGPELAAAEEWITTTNPPPLPNTDH